ncbi:multicopper oxidase family protein [Paenibacillus whitsoniae]|uniref:Multicopper oxidase family protein n=1 Tax=Paenibacillus whitsoniae TaxID=2496558 RepID=A0A430J7C9_9BACL|nr:multicopper oxidase family protein [Paenibacillus whitsoniae]RTE05468.1 multicopper oxidase family protein [Paenibacillus whitsoniae]
MLTRRKTVIYVGILLLIVLMIGAAVSTYLWQMRLQKPVEMSMAHHTMGGMTEMAGMGHMEHMAGMENSPAEGELSCDSLTAPESSAPIRKFELTAAQTTLKLANGEKVKAWTFNGSSPGPELRVTEGNRVVITLHNKDIEDGVTIHFHGIKVPCSQDGIAGLTQDAVLPGGQFTYTFIATTPGTYWYHSHQMSSIQVSKGLLGALIVEPKTGYQSDAPISDTTVLYQQLDSSMLVNGRAEGIAVPGQPGEQARLRLINAGNETMEFNIDGASFRGVAMDGHDLHEPGLLEGVRVPIGAGQRYDLLIQVPNTGKVIISSPMAKNLPITIGSGSEPQHSDGGQLFSFIDYGTPLPNDTTLYVQPDRLFNLELGQNLFVKSINGKAFSDIPPMIVKEGDHVRINVSNRGGGDHPFHIHGHVFRVLSKNGVALRGSPVYLDTLLTKEGETYELYLEADNPGLWMVHCHNLKHASMGMSMMLDYEGISTSYRLGTKSGNLPDL